MPDLKSVTKNGWFITIEQREYNRLREVFLAAHNLHFTEDLSKDNLRKLVRELKIQLEMCDAFYFGRE